MSEKVQKSAYELLSLPDERGLDRLRQEWSMDSHPLEASTLVFRDTFEWGLWFGGYQLYSCDNLYLLADRQESCPGAVVCEEQVDGRRCFWQEFKTGAMRSVLQDKLGLRGLAVVAEGMFRRQDCDLRNEAGKVVCRLRLSSVSSVKPEQLLLQSCQVLPLRGYETEALEVTACLIEYGATRSGQDPLELLLQKSGNLPRRYTLRPEFGLEMVTPAREATGRIVRAMLELAVSNLPGIRNDLDTEFLHDYRICLRKIRSLLTLVKNVYPAEDIQQMRTILGNLARQTNRLRDLDVYLLAREEYLGLLPQMFRSALNAMFDEFAAARETEVRKVITLLSGTSFERRLHGVTVFFAQNTVHAPTTAAELPVGPLVFAAIYRRYRKISKIGAAIDAATPDEGIHQLRIECKKLRYLMEFFNELIPKETGAALQKLLRRLQGRLGEFNDASVQQKSLLDYWEHRKAGAEVALGLGGLVSILYQRQQQTRSLIKQSLDEFCSASTAALFKRTFKSPAPVLLTDVNRYRNQ